MKLISSIEIIILLMSFNIKAQTFTLTVNNGIGSGIYNEGDTIHVWANSVFGDSVFTYWTGTGLPYLTFDDEWHTTLIVPSNTNVGSLTLSANFDVIPATSQIGSLSFLLFGENNGVQTNVMKEVYYAVPPNTKGIVFLLHGTGGEGKNFFTKYERYVLVKDLVYNGFAVFTLDANERTMGDQNGDGKIRWDNSNAGFANSSNNIDILNVKSLRDSVINTFSLSQNIPTYTLGMSAGAVFSDICASALGFNASAHITAKGKSDTYTRADIVPVIWIMSENDHNQSADNTIAYNNYLTMSTNQTAEWHWFKRSPVYSIRFIRSLNNITTTQADSVFQRLQTNGFLNTNNFLTVLDVSLIPASILDNLGLSADQKLDIYQQLLCVNADHVLHSDYDKNIIRFFNQYLNTTSIHIDNDNLKKLLVYPNPTTGKLRFSSNINYHKMKISIYNILGEKISSYNNITNGMLDLNNLSNGVYFLNINNEGKIFTIKIIKN